MLFDYKKYRLDNGISENTIIHEVQTINSLKAFLNLKYKRKCIEPHEIRPIDIREFLDNEREKGLKDTTINRKLIAINNWFHYLWVINKIPLDFMPKFKYSEQLDLKSKNDITLNYQVLLGQKSAFLRDPKIMLVTKMLFVFYMRGIRLRDIIQIEINNIFDHSDVLEVIIEKKKEDSFVKLVFTEEEEISVLLAGMERAIFRNCPFLFSSKVKDQYVMFRISSLKDYHAQMQSYFKQPIRSEELRFAYVHYLYKVKEHTIEEIMDALGISIDNATNLLRQSLERMSSVVYNEEKITN